MKTRICALAILALLATGGALAEGPVNYPEQAPLESVKTRAQVHAELMEARKLGLVVYGEADVPILTSEQEKQIADAGQRALKQEIASK